eukprot:CAMPEP_0171187202 /NCGR_PEP_ID=MMETSP0790-20130122/17200_1 /TAXON_ID=2925 /ORGANISM="Alexandrium catenella, Strain OF101" /LENGTH=54 /DNA_ID=CAMNT_0011652257 /DNA_START=581 /DNA_END=745 /DNA_ORIENTATION=-
MGGDPISSNIHGEEELSMDLPATMVRCSPTSSAGQCSAVLSPDVAFSRSVSCTK